MKSLVNKIKFFLLTYYPYLIIVLLITLPWFLKSGYLFFTDFSLGPKVIIDWGDTGLISDLLIKVFSFILPVSFVQKVFIFVVLFFVLWGGKKIIENFITDRWLIFSVSLFSLFNPFVYDRLMYGQFGVVLAFGFFCAMIGALLKFLFRRDNGQIILAGLYLALALHFSPHFSFFALLIGLALLPAIIFSSKKISRRKVLSGILLATLIVLVINSVWAFNFFVKDSDIRSLIDSGIEKQDFFAFETAGKNVKEVFANVLLMSGFWGKDQFRYADLTNLKENWGRSFAFLSPLFIFGLIVGLRDKKKKILVSGLLVAFVVAVVLAVGVRWSVGRDITEWLFDHLKIYRGLRETQKWVSVEVVVYLILISIGVAEIFKKKGVAKNKFLVQFLLIFAIIMQAPLLLFGFSDQVRAANYPVSWYDADHYLVETTACQGKTLFLPWHMYMGLSFAGSVTNNPAPKFFTCPVISGTNMEFDNIYDSHETEESLMIGQWVMNHGKNDLLDKNSLDIRYIVLAKEVDWHDYLWLDDSSQVELVKDLDTLLIYKVKKNEN